MLEITNLNKTYKNNNKHAVKDVSLTLKPGEIFGFLGLNGAGKTTTFKCITGIIDFDSGNIKVNGYDIKKDELKAKASLAYIPDNHATFEELTGREYINFMADIYGVSKELRITRMNELAKMLNLEENLNQLIKTYSHGMKQKIAIIGGIIHQPPLWILDEPLVGLDPFSMKEIKEFMKEYARRGNTIIFSSHIMNIVRELCDRVMIIDQGEIKAEVEGSQMDKVEELFLGLVER